VCGRYYRLADMDAYRLFVYRDDGHLIGPAKTIHAANDAEAIGYAKAAFGVFLFPHRPGLRWLPIRGCNIAADSAASQNSLRPQTLARRMENENDVAI
jgi:hypothetical protein